CKLETLREAYRLAKQNDGAPGIDRVTFEAIEAVGLEAWLQQLRAELLGHSYLPRRLRRVEIPKRGGKGVRVLSIPTIRDHYQWHLLQNRPQHWLEACRLNARFERTGRHELL
ncbi:MAG: hypothetical protein JOZ29_09820, partial [Deltaproteobacteria bacterium]|nr:hypothetical protein [Deltaproteobacteria bacterium]